MVSCETTIEAYYVNNLIISLCNSIVLLRLSSLLLPRLVNLP